MDNVLPNINERSGEESRPYDRCSGQVLQKDVHTTFPNPSALWKLIEKYQVEPTNTQPSDEHSEPEITHRPKVLNWVYVLERTDVD